MTKRDRMTPRQARFVDEYLIDLNATQAAIRAGYSPRTATQQGERLLRNVEVCGAIEEGRKARQKRTGISQDDTLRELARVAFFDPRRLFNADGSPKGIHDLDDDTAAAVAGIEVLEQFEGSGKDRVFVGYLKKYKIADKNSALEKLMKHLGLYEKDNSQKTDPLRDLLGQLSGNVFGATPSGARYES
ncbi:terminase small subunit [Thauera sp. Sel9]|uniref:terminase small subunit n=1 Tax=Thauera sp. Sel9 TaxID=2974299 RepID=UPI0021E13AB1|nr:terminase small subunit [Thauera sp. Sel9]MCV2218889.1 terminase small subunit [Thauera sp. Sel9]